MGDVGGSIGCLASKDGDIGHMGMAMSGGQIIWGAVKYWINFLFYSPAPFFFLKNYAAVAMRQATATIMR